MEGWIKLHRQITEWEWYTDNNTFKVFIHLLIKANHDDRQWQGMIIKKGELVTSVRKLSDELGISVQSIRTSLNRLKSTHEVTQFPHTQFTHLSVNNYSEYQDTNTVANKQLTHSQHTANNKQELKNNKNNKNKTEGSYSSIEKITDKEIDEISDKYQVPVAFVRSKIDDMINWHGKNPKKNHYANYYRALCDWVKKDALKVKGLSQDGKTKIVYAGDTA